MVLWARVHWHFREISVQNLIQAPSKGPEECVSGLHPQIQASLVDKESRLRTTTPRQDHGRARMRQASSTTHGINQKGRFGDIAHPATSSSFRSRGSYQSLKKSLDPIQLTKPKGRLKSMELEEFYKQQEEEEEANGWPGWKASRSREAQLPLLH